MSFPESGIKSLIKNRIDDVEQFLEDKHKDNYLVVNLTDQQYDRVGRFNGRVLSFPFPDHSAPRMIPAYELIYLLSCFIQKHPSNTVVIHCKAGKGRTGSIICGLLLYMNPTAVSDDIIKYFGEQRSYDGLGLENICQLRFVRQFEQARDNDYKIFNIDNPQNNITILKAQLQTQYNIDVNKIFIEYYVQKSNIKQQLNFIKYVKTDYYSPQYSLSLTGDFSLVIEIGRKRKRIVAQLNTNFLDCYLLKGDQQKSLSLNNDDFDFIANAKLQNVAFNLIIEIKLSIS